MPNIYYDSADFGLITLDVLDETDLSFEYNKLLVVKHVETGRIFWAQDSGCSCPTPFEDYHFRFRDGEIDTDMSEITERSWGAFEGEVNSFPVPMSDRQACLSTVKRHASWRL